MNNSNAESDTSSVEILKALTTHLASPLDRRGSKVSPIKITNEIIIQQRPIEEETGSTPNQLDIEKPQYVASDSDCNNVVK